MHARSPPARPPREGGIQQAILQTREHIGPVTAGPGQNIGRERAVMCASLDELDSTFWTLRVHPLDKLESQQLAKERTDAHTGEEITAAPNFPAALIITQSGRVEGQLHEALEGNWAAQPDFFSNLAAQRVQGVCHSLASVMVVAIAI
jgi:hypothetical protein